MREVYDHSQIEKKCQASWRSEQRFVARENSDKPKMYCLPMLPYPSGKLHMGHVRNYAISDALARYYRLAGYNVLHTIGWDAFGLPAENAALNSKVAPAVWTYQNIATMRAQLQNMGLSFDYSREFATCSPEYYRHQQWLFLELYRRGIIYRKTGLVNWDPLDQTVLANEQVIDGKGWRSGVAVEKKHIPMYYFAITNYAQQLVDDLEQLDGWPESVRIMQKNWIGRSVGLEITFAGCDGHVGVSVYTTRPDTLAGVTYVAISPEHPLVEKALELRPEIADEITAYKSGGTSEAQLATAEKLGVFSGLYVIHPISGEKIPLWIANYVLMNYGTGAVMAVPSHDERDFEFASKYNLPKKVVIKPLSINETDGQSPAIEQAKYTSESAAYTEYGILCNSGKYDGMTFEQAFVALSQDLQKAGLGSQKVNYRLRDWGLSRQRYWGCPIPIIHCDNCGEVPVPQEDLPVILPEDLIPDGSGNPLVKDRSFNEVNCPKCNSPARRETDTMDTFVDSSWYFLRYACADNAKQILDERVNYWLPANQYIGGIEHAILHLLYSRFFYKVLRDIGLVKGDEPFKNLLTQGMVLAEVFYRNNPNGSKSWFNLNEVEVKRDNKGNIVSAILNRDGQTVNFGGIEKMSKSKNNGVDPDEIIARYGADTARLFVMFASPPEQTLVWSDSGIEGSERFIRRLWRLVYEHKQRSDCKDPAITELNEDQMILRRELHQTIAKVTNDIAKRKQFNTYIAAIMELLNLYSKLHTKNPVLYQLAQEVLSSVVIMLSPIIPHVTSVLYNELTGKQLDDQSWPTVDNSALEINSVELILQVNGKLRGKIVVDKDLDREQIEHLATQNPNVHKFIEGQQIKKVIIVPNKLVNIVI